MIKLQEPACEEPWGGVTSPEQHDPNSFRYLVTRDKGLHSFERRPFRQPRITASQYYVQQPEQMLDAEVIWCSLIDQDHMGVYEEGWHALIVEVDPDGVVITAPSDTRAGSNESILQDSQAAILSPDQLLEETESAPFANNRVIVASGAILAIAGIYIPLRHRYDYFPRLSGDELQAIATENDLPVIAEHRKPVWPSKRRISFQTTSLVDLSSNL